MAYVMSVHNLKAYQRKRSPLGRFAAWTVEKTGETLLNKLITFLINCSPVVRFAVGMVVSLTLGVLIDFAFRWVPVSIPLNVSAVLGGLAGMAAQGVGGGIIGGLWGWLIGAIVDTVVSGYSSEQLGPRIGEFVAWGIATVVGWSAGRLASWCYDKLPRRFNPLRTMLQKLSLTVALACVAILLYNAGKWVISNIIVRLSSVPHFGLYLGFWLLTLVIWVMWIIALVAPVYWVLDWKYPFLFKPMNISFQYGDGRVFYNHSEPYWIFDAHKNSFILVVLWILWIILLSIVTAWVKHYMPIYWPESLSGAFRFTLNLGHWFLLGVMWLMWMIVGSFLFAWDLSWRFPFLFIEGPLAIYNIRKNTLRSILTWFFCVAIALFVTRILG